MKKHMQKLSLALLTSAAVFSGSSALGATLSDVFQAAEQMNAQAKRSQAKIDDLTEETRQLLNEYKTVLKEVEGLRVYNRQLEKQIGNQEREMEQLARSIDEVTVIERQITPLMLRMIDGLEQFVELDAPFLLDERRGRVERLREMMDRADGAVEPMWRFLRSSPKCSEPSRLRTSMAAQWKPTLLLFPSMALSERSTS